MIYCFYSFPLENHLFPSPPTKRLILKIQISPISPSRDGLGHNPSFPDPTLAKSYSTNLYKQKLLLYTLL